MIDPCAINNKTCYHKGKLRLSKARHHQRGSYDLMNYCMRVRDPKIKGVDKVGPLRVAWKWQIMVKVRTISLLSKSNSKSNRSRSKIEVRSKYLFESVSKGGIFMNRSWNEVWAMFEAGRIAVEVEISRIEVEMVRICSHLFAFDIAWVDHVRSRSKCEITCLEWVPAHHPPPNWNTDCPQSFWVER